MNVANNLLYHRYEIIHEIGFGSSGSVCTAHDLLDDKQIAIKKIPISAREQVERLKRECFFLKTVSHPNLVKAYHFFTEDKYAYMTLEYVHGKSLGEIINKNKHGMSLVGQLAIASQIARGIEVLNIGGIIHRDIKPHNVMLNTKTGEIKILDLGIAKGLDKQLASLTNSGEIVGTCAYMSPEQTHGKLSEKTDIFAMGILLYQLFTWSDSSPFATNNIYATVYKIRNHNPPDLCSVIHSENTTPLQQEALEKIAQVIAKALNKNPDERWDHAGIVADKFNEIQRELITEVKERPEKYKIVTARQISPEFRKMLLEIREKNNE